MVARGALIAVALGACRDAPSTAELDELRAEAITANEAALAKERERAPDEPGHTLTVSGQLGMPGATLDWAELQRIGTSHVQTINPQNPDKKTPTNFRGVLVRDLLERFDADPTATEATFVALDGFRATVELADARTHRMLLALEAEGRPIPKSSGGPIFLVHPWSEAKEMQWKYPDRFWSFYVSHLVIGTEEPRLVVGGKVLTRDDLAKLPAATYDGPVSWKVEWPADVVHLRGVRVTDVLAAAGVTLPPDGFIVIRGKAPLHDDPAKPIKLAIADLERCRPILAMQFGPDEKPITARRGGPLALAHAPCGEAYGERLWVTFVERLEVVPP